MVRRETQMVEKCCGSKWLVSIATGGHSAMTTSIGTERARNVILPVIAVDSHHAQAKCAPLRLGFDRTRPGIMGNHAETQGRTATRIARAPLVSADGLIIVATGPVFHPTTWLVER